MRTIGSLSSDHGDGNENGKEPNGKTTTLHVHHAFLYISLPRENFFLLQLSKKVDSAIRWINLYLVDNAIGFPNIYPLDSDLSGG